MVDVGERWEYQLSAYAVGSWAVTALMRRPRRGEDSRGPPAAAARRETGRTGVAPRETEEGAVWWLGEEERNERKAAAAAWAAVAMAGKLFGAFRGFLAWIGERDRAEAD
jgi:hypothetical protein